MWFLVTSQMTWAPHSLTPTTLFKEIVMNTNEPFSGEDSSRKLLNSPSRVLLPLKYLLVGGAVGLLIIFVLLVEYTESRDSPKETKSASVTELDSLSSEKGSRPRIRTTFDGGKVLVIPHSQGFNFYRDEDSDGIADSEGSGFYMGGVSEITDEDSLLVKITMDSLKARYLPD